MYVYAAGPIANLHYNDTVDWRLELERLLSSPYDGKHITVLSPMRAKQYLSGKIIGAQSYDTPLSSDDGITMRDRFDVQRSDLVVCNLLGATEKSIGTCIEIGWADAWRKPIVLIMEDGDVHDHPMVRSIAGGVMVSSLEAAAELVKAILLP